MTKERYLEMMEQLGEEPKPEEIPPDFEDFPPIVAFAMNTFNMLGDRMYPDIGYVGKDYTNLKHFMDVYGIEDKEFFLDILYFLDSRAIKKSAEMMKREREKLKRKSRG